MTAVVDVQSMLDLMESDPIPPDDPAELDAEVGAVPAAPKIARSQTSRSLRVIRLTSVGVVVALLVLLGWRLISSSRGQGLVSAISAGKAPAAPQFHLAVIWPHTETWPAALRAAAASGRISPRALLGHPAVINFWASWCVPCKQEAPVLAASARAHAGQVAFLGIDVQDFRSDARRFLTKYKANYVSVRDGDGSTYSAYGLTGVPETYYLDARGRIVAHAPGQVSRRDLETGIQAAVRSDAR